MPALLIAAGLAVLGFENGGFFPPMWSWLSFACACVLLAVALVRAPPRWSRLELATCTALAALAGWTLLSALWSASPSETVREAERALLYGAAVAVVFTLAEARQLRKLILAVVGAIVVVVSYALAQYLFSSHPRPEGFEGFLLFRPVGYANALGILATLGLLLVLGLVSADSTRPLRALGTSALVPLAAALVLTSSRGAVVALALGLAVMFAFARERLHLATVALLVAPAPLAAVALSVHARLSTGTPFFRAHDAEHLGLALVVLAVVAGVGGLLLRDSYSRRVTVAAAGTAAACLLAVAASAAVAGRTPDAGGPRSDYWHVAWQEWRSRPVVGTGGGTFASYWRRTGAAGGGGAQDAHNLYLETLAELGIVGLALLVAALVMPPLAARRARHEPLAPAMLGAYAAYLLHAAVDWDWEMPVVTIAALSCGAGLLVAARGEQPAPVPYRLRVVLGVLGGALLVVSCIELFANDAVTV